MNRAQRRAFEKWRRSVKLRTFTVPFSDVAPDAQELEFGDTDQLTVRPLYTQALSDVTAWQERSAKLGAEIHAMSEMDKGPAREKEAARLDKASDHLILDLIGQTVVSWSLTGPDDKPIDVPKTPADLTALPSGLASRLFPFLSEFRGPNPTTRS